MGIRPAPGRADHAAEQREIHDGLHVLHTVYVVRNAHRPTEDRSLSNAA